VVLESQAVGDGSRIDVGESCREKKVGRGRTSSFSVTRAINPVALCLALYAVLYCRDWSMDSD